jgi:hypothetical protein
MKTEFKYNCLDKNDVAVLLVDHQSGLLIRVMNRLGRGYSFEALRAKILFTEGVCKIRKPKFKRPIQDEDMTDYNQITTFSRTTPSTISTGGEINYGADISTLVRMIEEGRL